MRHSAIAVCASRVMTKCNERGGTDGTVHRCIHAHSDCSDMVTNNPSDPVYEEIAPGNLPLMLHTLGGFFLPGIRCNITDLILHPAV
jgi:hypothetical protein